MEFGDARGEPAIERVVRTGQSGHEAIAAGSFVDGADRVTAVGGLLQVFAVANQSVPGAEVLPPRRGAAIEAVVHPIPRKAPSTTPGCSLPPTTAGMCSYSGTGRLHALALPTSGAYFSEEWSVALSVCQEAEAALTGPRVESEGCELIRVSGRHAALLTLALKTGAGEEVVEWMAIVPGDPLLLNSRMVWAISFGGLKTDAAENRQLFDAILASFHLAESDS